MSNICSLLLWLSLSPSHSHWCLWVNLKSDPGWPGKMVFGKHISVVPGDMPKRIISYPVFQEKGNKIILTYPWRKRAKTRKWKLTNIIIYINLSCNVLFHTALEKEILSNKLMVYLQLILDCWNLTLIDFRIVILLSDSLNISVWRLNIGRVGLF